jgi:Na+/H+ antiporter NhaD/arsenite permease-like protein
MIPLPMLTLLGVFLLIAVRKVGRFRFAIWEAMLLGAIIVLLSGDIAPRAALNAVNIDVMLFLFGMFVVGYALDESGYLAHQSYKMIKRARSASGLMAMIIAGAGVLSPILMNDTLAIIGTPVVLLIARKHGMSPKLLLISLAFAVTTGSVLSPIGNPQNLLIALNGRIGNPFLLFLRHLLAPTVVNLWLTFVVLKRFYGEDCHDAELRHSQEPIRDKELAFLSRISLQIVAVLVCVKIACSLAGLLEEFRLTHIALAACLPLLVGSRKRWRILRHIDWATLVFFASMFVLMESVWQTGFLQRLIGETALDLGAPGVIIGISIGLSQFISNVPLVALYQPLLLSTGAGVPELMALAAGSTIAGNMFILGAASNVIIIQNAERKGGETISFLEFARAGVPLTLLQAVVYWLFLTYL